MTPVNFLGVKHAISIQWRCAIDDSEAVEKVLCWSPLLLISFDPPSARGLRICHIRAYE